MGTRADDLAWTLHDSHGTRMAAAKEALDAATAKRTELTAERDAASTAKIAATKELSGAFRAEASGEARRDSAFDAAAAQLKDYIDASAVDKKNKMISLPDTEAAVAPPHGEGRRCRQPGKSEVATRGRPYGEARCGSGR